MQAAPAFTVSSDDVADGKMMGSAQVYEGFGCSGGNLAPQLAWKNAPAGTKSLAVTVYDPEAPRTSELVLTPAGQELGVANLPGSHGYLAEVVSFSPALVARFRSRHGGLIDGQLRQAATASLCVPLDTHAALAWDQLMASLANGAPPALQAHQSEGLLLVLALQGHCKPLLMDRRDPLAARVQQVLLLDPAADWNVPSVAAQLKLGASTLRRQLAVERRHFRDILDDVRLGMALQELQAGISPIGDIAAACGYASASRFAARFRQRYGLSPRDLRAIV